jgi:hypothetical protein
MGRTDRNTPLSPSELREVQQELSQMSVQEVWRAYEAAYDACRPGRDRLPRPVVVQQLVLAWRELVRRVGFVGR